MQVIGGPTWCMGSPSRLTKSAKESPCFSMPMRLAMTLAGSRASATGYPRPSMRYSSLIFAPFSGALRQVDQPGAVQGGHRLLGIVVKVLADDEDGLAVAVAARVRET